MLTDETPDLLPHRLRLVAAHGDGQAREDSGGKLQGEGGRRLGGDVVPHRVGFGTVLRTTGQTFRLRGIVEGDIVYFVIAVQTADHLQGADLSAAWCEMQG